VQRNTWEAAASGGRDDIGKGKVETRRQKLEWGDAGLPGKGDRDVRTWSG